MTVFFVVAGLVGWAVVVGVVRELVFARRELDRVGRAVDVPDERETIGINTLAHLSQARVALQERLLETHMNAGVFIEDPATTYIDWGVKIEDTPTTSNFAALSRMASGAIPNRTGPLGRVSARKNVVSSESSFPPTLQSNISTSNPARRSAPAM